MKEVGGSSISRLRSEQGQIIWWMPLLIVVFFGMAGITLDLGRAYVAYRELQASTDAAALAGAYAMTTATSTSTIDAQVKAYSSVTGQANATPNLPGASITTSYKCVNDNANMVPIQCNAFPAGYNLLQVMQTSTVPMYFIRTLSLFGIKAASSITLRSYATATTGGQPTQVNVAVILDSTASMQQNDTACGKNVTKEACALGGVQTLLQGLTPCAPGSVSCSYDSVSLFTFPNIAANSTGADTNCSGSPNIIPYTAPTTPTSSTNSWTAPTGSSGTYQLTGFLYDYSSNNQTGGSISTTSQLGMATGAKAGCSGIQPKGGQGTYLAGAIYAAQTALMAKSYNTATQNVMIVLSDGDQNISSSQANFGKTKSFSYKDSTGYTSTYPSTTDQCHQSIAAANYAKALGTTVYTIGYAASTSGTCTTDKTKPITACDELKDMASSSVDFYGYGGNCSTNSDLDDIFGDIKYQLSKARLIPNGTT
jgi:Putative Flp pilus-assembly TadE/G-like